MIMNVKKETEMHSPKPIKTILLVLWKYAYFDIHYKYK